MNPWLVALIVVHRSHDGAERRTLARDVERRILSRIRPGVYVEQSLWQSLDERSQHIVRMRALVATSSEPVVFSHWSAAVVHRLPFRGESMHLRRLHVTVADQERRGSRIDVAAHVFTVTEPETVQNGELLLTSAARTVVDIAGARPFHEGVVVADAALRAHLPRELLEHAVDVAGPRRAGERIGQVAAFAHPGAESVAESESRVLMFRHGIEPPELQREFWDARGFAGRTDTWWRRRRAIGEIDGRKKFLNASGSVLWDEKQREDRLRAQSDGFVRWGWPESIDPLLLLPILARVGIVPLRARPTLADYAVLAHAARPTALWEPDRVLLGG